MKKGFYGHMTVEKTFTSLSILKNDCFQRREDFNEHLAVVPAGHSLLWWHVLLDPFVHAPDHFCIC